MSLSRYTKGKLITFVPPRHKKKFTTLSSEHYTCVYILHYIDNYYAFCKFLLLYKFIRYFGIYHKELYSVDILCENSTSTMPVSRGEGWVFSCLSSYA